MSTPSLDKPVEAAQCDCGQQANTNQRIVKWATAGGVFAALGVCAACCLLPFALVSIGVAGAWVGALDAFAPYKWILVIVSAALLGYGFYAVYWRPQRKCAAGTACKVCGTGGMVRLALWAGTLLAVGGIAFLYLEPLLTDH